MNFAYGVIATVGVLIALSLGLIAADPGYVAAPSEVQDVKDTVPQAPMSATVSLPEGTSIPGCESSNECFIPYNVSVSAGGMVTWSNDDTAAHTVTSGSLPEGPDGLFDSGLFMAGTAYEVMFDEAGEYDYFCIVHPWMVGKVTVV